MKAPVCMYEIMSLFKVNLAQDEFKRENDIK